jgi:hypothetical protein
LSNVSLSLRPRPPDTTRLAVLRSGRDDVVRSSPTQVVGHGAFGSEENSSTVPSEEPSSAAGYAVPRTVINLIGSNDFIVETAFPIYLARPVSAVGYIPA